MKSQEIINKLNNFNKSYFTFKDFELMLGKNAESIKTVLNRLVKSKNLTRLARNIYVLPEKIQDFELIAQQLNLFSYISFESALSYYGILSQVPYALILATTKKSKTITLGEKTIIYRRIKKELFFGYSLENNIKLALPEKALADSLYLITRGKLTLPLDELDLSSINKKEMEEILKKYPKSVRFLFQKIDKNSQ